MVSSMVPANQRTRLLPADSDLATDRNSRSWRCVSTGARAQAGLTRRIGLVRYTHDYGEINRWIPPREAVSSFSSNINLMKTARSFRAFTVVEVIIAVAILGVVAAITIIAIQRVRIDSHHNSVLSNVRQLAAAADQYYLKANATYAAIEELVGADKYVKALNRFALEAYPHVYTQGVTITVHKVGGSRTITYAP